MALKILQLSRGKTAIVDEEDFERVSLYKWYLGKNGYAINTKYIKGSGRKNQKNRYIYLHRLIMNAPKGSIIDHINRNPLDNRKVNLRLGSQRINMLNAGMLKNNTSGFKGVSWHKTAKKWEAYTHYHNKKIGLGLFKNKRDAIEIREQTIINLFI